MGELFPLLSGLVVGALLGYVRPRTRVVTGVLAALALGATATVVTGEYRISWEFLLVDIPLVGLSSAVAFLVSRMVRRRQLAAGNDGHDREP